MLNLEIVIQVLHPLSHYLAPQIVFSNSTKSQKCKLFRKKNMYFGILDSPPCKIELLSVDANNSASMS